ncbi:unnamed protein product [Didymodactylos carnosus]|uniref:Uncharacterized protein n=1 Tax=Didymodactylos carnosus TaxID=1234261 RepID=A0A8S2JG76_9BILA|nr:unnamed protein product [Didymodactylos carnosus]CAF3809597.1 unnamed protein product [Didymodactylos carnosus]
MVSTISDTQTTVTANDAEKSFYSSIDNYIGSLQEKFREKYVIKKIIQNNVMKALTLEKGKKSSSFLTSLVYWANKNFEIKKIADVDVLYCSSNKPVCVYESLFTITSEGHRHVSHSSRDKTLAEINSHWSCVPRAVVEIYLKHRTACQVSSILGLHRAVNGVLTNALCKWILSNNTDHWSQESGDDNVNIIEKEVSTVIESLPDRSENETADAAPPSLIELSISNIDIDLPVNPPSTAHMSISLVAFSSLTHLPVHPSVTRAPLPRRSHKQQVTVSPPHAQHLQELDDLINFENIEQPSKTVPFSDVPPTSTIASSPRINLVAPSPVSSFSIDPIPSSRHNAVRERAEACNSSRASQGGYLCSGDPLQTRSCVNALACPGNSPSPSAGGSMCIGAAMNISFCNGTACPVSGAWSLWSPFGACSGTCGTGIQVRSRNCSAQLGSDQCPGSPIDTQQCDTTISCPTDGQWGAWTGWTNCSSIACVGSSMYRFRTCNNPAPMNGGQLCSGSALDTQTCAIFCPPAGNWADWGVWSTCSSTCLGGRRYRNRTCTNPAPVNGSAPCIGSSIDIDYSCGNTTCGGASIANVSNWSNWGSWSSCAGTCNLGIQRRVRITCTKIVPSFGGDYCPGSPTLISTCINSQPCPIDGQWGSWSPWSACSATCGKTATKYQTRQCLNVNYGGLQCQGIARNDTTCPELSDCPACPFNQQLVTTPETCPALCSDSSDTTWCQDISSLQCLCTDNFAWDGEDCVLWCDCGCYGTDGTKYSNNSIWTENSCQTYQCQQQMDGTFQSVLINNTCQTCSWIQWNPWSSCNSSSRCGQGTQSRTRSCLSRNNTACRTCSGNSTQSQICQQVNCEVCKYGPFIPIGSCSQTCGSGTQLWNRTCYNVAYSNSSIPVPCSNATGCANQGNSLNTTVCATNVCLNCTWSTWAQGPCSVTCGAGTYLRTQYCNDQFNNPCTNCTTNANTNPQTRSSAKARLMALLVRFLATNL